MIKQAPCLLMVDLLLLLILLSCAQFQTVTTVNGMNCGATITMDSYFDTANIVSDQSCNPTLYEYAVSNTRTLSATFPYTPKGKVIFGSGLTMTLKYIFNPYSSNFKHNTSVFINDAFIMKLPVSAFSFCNNPSYSLDSFSQPITSYLDLGSSNTFKITTDISIPTVSLYVTNVKLSFCYVPYNVSIVDLVISSNISSISFLSPSSHEQVRKEPFSGLYINQLSDVATIPIQINNKAIDGAMNITITVYSPYLPLFTISLENIQKISPSYQFNVYPEIENISLSSYTTTFTLYNVNLTYVEKLALNLVFQLNETNLSIDSSFIRISVDASNDLVEEIYSTDNTKSFSFGILQTKMSVSASETSANPIINVKNKISDLAFFVHKPQSPFTSNCWYQVNLVTSTAFSGSLYIYSNKTMTQRKIDFVTQDFIGTSRLFLAIPSDQLDCTNAGGVTEIYLRVEADSASFRLYLSRKFYSVLSDDNLTINSIYTPKLESGEAFGLSVSTLTKLEQVPLQTNLDFFNFDSSVDKFLAFNLQKSSNVELLSSSKAVAVPQNAFPMAPLSSSNLLYFFEKSCASCSVNLALTYPSIYLNPPALTKYGVFSIQTQKKSQASNGVHWMFVNTTKVSSEFVRMTVIVTVTSLVAKIGDISKIPPKLSLIATKDFIDSSVGTNGENSRSLSDNSFYNQTADCSATRNSSFSRSDPKISINIPLSTGNVWKFGFFIDPSYEYASITYEYLAQNYSNTLYGSLGYDYISKPFGNFYYAINVDYSVGMQQSEAVFNFDSNNMRMFDRYYEIFVKIGKIPTTLDYDTKTPPFSYNSLTSTYSLRYFFSNKGTFALQGDSFQLISSEKLDKNGQTIYLYFREIPGSVYPSVYSCYLPSTTTKSTYFSHSYSYNAVTQSDTSLILYSPNLYLNASYLNISTSNIGKYVNIQFSTAYNVPVGEKVYIFDYYLNELVPMNATYFTSYINYYDNDGDYKYKYYQTSTRLNARIRITDQLVNNRNNLFISILFPPNTYSKYTTNYVYVFTEEDVKATPIILPIMIAIAVMGGLFILSCIYLIICIVLIFTKATKNPTISENYNASNNAFKNGSGLTVFLDLFLLVAASLSGIVESITKKKMHTLVAKSLLGLICLVCCVGFYIGLLVPMGVITSTLSNPENDTLQKGDKLTNETYYACCRFKAPKSISTYSQAIMETDDGNLSCIKTGYSTSTTNLTINGVLYPASVNSYPFAVGGSLAIMSAKLQCPNSDIVFISTSFDSINSMAIAGIVLGTFFLFLSILYISTAVSDYLIKKYVNDKWNFNWRKTPSTRQGHIANTSSHSSALRHHSDSDSNHRHSMEIGSSVSRIQEEHLRREREEMERVDRENILRKEAEKREREERLRREREARNQLLENVRNNPPEVKLPPPKPNQPTEVEIPEISFTSPTAPPLDVGVVQDSSSNIFVYDNSTQGNTIANSSHNYNPYENNDDVVVFYQRSDQTNPQSQ